MFRVLESDLLEDVLRLRRHFLRLWLKPWDKQVKKAKRERPLPLPAGTRKWLVRLRSEADLLPRRCLRGRRAAAGSASAAAGAAGVAPLVLFSRAAVMSVAALVSPALPPGPPPPPPPTTALPPGSGPAAAAAIAAAVAAAESYEEEELDSPADEEDGDRSGRARDSDEGE